MSSSATTGGVDRAHDRSFVPKLIFAALHGSIVGLCLWLAFALEWADTARAKLLAACVVLYFLRHMITLFVLLKRKVDLLEALGLSAFMALFEIGFLLLGAGIFRDTAVPFGGMDMLAMGLIALGSYLNTSSELQRLIWKKRPESKGRCYTGGLFKHSMHINYFGDMVLFTGWALLTTSWLAFVIPLFMTVGFVFFHIPGLDAYLSQRYGAEFDAYATKTAKLIPFVY
ncbi:DUF1295 domain-containing protein [uncultured Shimia sp.]|uniref:DUF1295 domain-containing protein n=1 Tax=uncultured Shimia sp. TaxID=573152 RepID=UPI0026197AA7|nr:DUF1295 domain-containing protein [uncultured Shimia sp.]